MLDNHASNEPRADTQVRNIFGRDGIVWTADEIARLTKLAPIPTTRHMLLAAFPDRGLPGIKKKLADVRDKLGLKRTFTRYAEATLPELDPNDEGIIDFDHRAWRRSCERQNAAFLAALRRAAGVR